MGKKEKFAEKQRLAAAAAATSSAGMSMRTRDWGLAPSSDDSVRDLLVFNSSGSKSIRGGVAEAMSAAAEQGVEVDWSQFAVTGTCTVLEKRYFRLLAPPDPSTVRPEPILSAALESFRERYREGSVTYPWLCDQLKSIRQDLAVQHLRGTFTTSVYAAHARFALENGDTAEFNQCQGQLESLWDEKIVSEDASSAASTAAFDADLTRIEFAAYRLLYNGFTAVAYDAKTSLPRMTSAIISHPWVRHALAVVSALTSENWQSFFRLYR